MAAELKQSVKIDCEAELIDSNINGGRCDSCKGDIYQNGLQFRIKLYQIMTKEICLCKQCGAFLKLRLAHKEYQRGGEGQSDN